MREKLLEIIRQQDGWLIFLTKHAALGGGCQADTIEDAYEKAVQSHLTGGVLKGCDIPFKFLIKFSGFSK